MNTINTVMDMRLDDFTDSARFGIRGKQVAARLAQMGYRLPEKPNQAVCQNNGEWLARLSQTEFFLLDKPTETQRIAQLEQDWQDSTDCYGLPRQDSHAWFAVSGSRLPEMMAKLCGVDLSVSVFMPGEVVQSSVARINVVIINVSQTDEPCFYLLFDRASADYFQAALADAMQEFAG